ncbi:sucrose-6-phosphate hydrolase [Salsuginibacillus kocurii]|uniref:sucrose-6-phosphate hydrolase n=1 Tax=Salsuginibacillus kocurii TaxID=427078 RepID=UPI00035CB39A|nr:sucrose-6-phosphate hydrolase [Salsuginibacillus kocurii]
MSHNQSSLRLHQEAYKSVAAKAPQVEKDPYRQTYHIQPPVGLLNDPNGLIHWKGEYHVFFQWNPFAPDHSSKFWAHMVSSDLINWRWAPIALAPSDRYDKNGCYSGSAIEVDSQLHLFYTGNVKDEQGERESYQCLATSEDGLTFEKEGPLVEVPPGFTAHFRDPKVWREDDTYWMILGAQTEDKEGSTVLYRSENARDWSYVGIVAGSNYGPLENFGFMWECPDLFMLNGKDVLVFSPQGLEAEENKYQNIYQSGYVIGEWDKSTGRMEHGDFTELDYGFEFYAPQTFVAEDGRRLLIGWMGVPEQCEESQPSVQNEWIHCLTIPRELNLREGLLYQTPARELKQLRADVSNEKHLQAGDARSFSLDLPANAYELVLSEVKIPTGEVTIQIDDTMVLTWNKESKQAILKRVNWETQRWETRRAPLDYVHSLQLFADASSLELFFNDGEVVLSSRRFPSSVQEFDLTVELPAGGELKAEWFSLKEAVSSPFDLVSFQEEIIPPQE